MFQVTATGSFAGDNSNLSIPFQMNVYTLKPQGLCADVPSEVGVEARGLNTSTYS